MPALICQFGPGQTCVSACRVEPEEAVSWYPGNIGFECLQHLARNTHEACLLKYSRQLPSTTAKATCKPDQPYFRNGGMMRFL